MVSGPQLGQNTRYQTHDLTGLLKAGSNAVGVLAGQVMDSSGQFMAVIMVQLSRGPPIFFTTADKGWLATESFVTSGA